MYWHHLLCCCSLCLIVCSDVVPYRVQAPHPSMVLKVAVGYQVTPDLMDSVDVMARRVTRGDQDSPELTDCQDWREHPALHLREKPDSQV